MDDDEFLSAFLQGWPSAERFGHYEHLRAAWLAIERHGAEVAADVVGEGIRRIAAAQGKASKYNDTLSRFWVRVIAHVRDAKGPFDGLDGAIREAPVLLDRNLALRHWSRSVLYGPEARAGWVEPDLVPLGMLR